MIDDAGWRRLDARMLLVHPVREVGRYIPFLIVAFLAGRGSGNGHWWSLLGLVVVIGFSVVRWATTGYRITPDQVQLRTGLLRKRIITTPADRVRTVDVVERPFHRLLGLATVSIGTGMATRKEGGLELDGLDRRAALALRQELLHRSGIAQEVSAPPPAPVAAAADTVILKLDPSWVRFAPFTLSGAVTALAILGFGWNLVQQAQVNAGNIGPIHSFTRHLQHLAVWVAVLQVAALILVLVSALAVVGYLLAYWNYQLSRHPGGTIGVRRGLLTTRSVSIEHRRLRGVELTQPLLLRLVSGARLLAVASGLREGRGRDRGGSILVPPAPVSTVMATARSLLDGAGSEQVLHAPLTAHGPAARRRRLVRAVTPPVLVEVLLLAGWRWWAFPAWLPVAGLLLVLAGVLLGRDRYTALAHGVVGQYLVTRYGAIDRRRVVLDCDGIIGWNVRQSVFQRRVGLVTVTATTAAGRHGYPLVDVPAGEALATVVAASPGLLDEFLLPVPGARHRAAATE